MILLPHTALRSGPHSSIVAKDARMPLLPRILLLRRRVNRGPGQPPARLRLAGTFLTAAVTAALVARQPAAFANAIILHSFSPPSSVADSERALRRRVARAEAQGMESLFGSDSARRRRSIPPDMRRLIVNLKAEYPGLNPNDISRVCYVRFGRRTVRKTVNASRRRSPYRCASCAASRLTTSSRSAGTRGRGDDPASALRD